MLQLLNLVMDSEGKGGKYDPPPEANTPLRSTIAVVLKKKRGGSGEVGLSKGLVI